MDEEKKVEEKRQIKELQFEVRLIQNGVVAFLDKPTGMITRYFPDTEGLKEYLDEIFETELNPKETEEVDKTKTIGELLNKTDRTDGDFSKHAL